LTHPGIPTVYGKHYFDWGSSLQAKLEALINARKVAGVNSGSVEHLQDNAAARGVYAVRDDDRIERRQCLHGEGHGVKSLGPHETRGGTARAEARGILQRFELLVLD
jgi:hypothetical protein